MVYRYIIKEKDKLMNRRMRKIVKWLLVAIFMLFIFYMSSREGDKSTGDSSAVINFIKLYLGIDLDMISNGNASFIVRKTAHATEYMILFLLIYMAVKEYENFERKILLSLIITICYAISDEIHQYFVPGRDMRIFDVMVDSTGALIGVILLKIKNKFKKIHL